HALVEVTGEPWPDFVFSIHRKHIGDQRSATCAQGQSRQVRLLRQIIGNTKVIDVGCGLRRTDRKAADSLSGDEVTLHQCRRNLEYAGNVVKAVADIVRGKQGGNVHVETKKVAHSIAIFG